MRVSGRPLRIDLYCGLGGWTEGLLAEGYDVVGFDLDRHVYGEHRYQAQLVIQDVLTLHGQQFKDAALIVASPPCQEYSYMSMPWSRAKAIAAEYRSGVRDVRQLTALFDACFRIQREAIEAAGHHIPLVVENVRGAIPWVGRSRWNFGSFHLWGDVPALMPITVKALKGHGGAWFKDSETADGTYAPGNFRIGVDGVKVSTMGAGWYPPGHPKHVAGLAFNTHAERGIKASDLVQQRDGASHTRQLTNQREHDGVKQAGLSGVRDNGKGDGWFQEGAARHGSKSNARKMASAMIAKIPLPLSRHIAKVYK